MPCNNRKYLTFKVGMHEGASPENWSLEKRGSKRNYSVLPAAWKLDARAIFALARVFYYCIPPERVHEKPYNGRTV